VKGEYQVAYVADETPMRTFVNTHAVLEARRVACREATASGQTGVAPVTMVVGPTDSGKSSLCKLLVNYAVRQVCVTAALTAVASVCSTQPSSFQGLPCERLLEFPVYYVALATDHIENDGGLSQIAAPPPPLPAARHHAPSATEAWQRGCVGPEATKTR